MAQQTAVEWLVEQVNSDCLNSTFIQPGLIKQAMEMEREQIVKAYYLHSYFDNYKEEDGEQYYNETYGK